MKTSFARADSVTHIQFKKELRAAAVLAANAAITTESQANDAADDEVSELNLGQPQRMPIMTKTINQTNDFGLPAHGVFSDAHDGQRDEPTNDRRASISTQSDFSLPDVLKEKLIAGKTSSFEPTSSQVNN